jgi:hypothetical protein
MEKVPNDLAAPQATPGSCSGPLLRFVCTFADFVEGGLKKTLKIKFQKKVGVVVRLDNGAVPEMYRPTPSDCVRER